LQSCRSIFLPLFPPHPRSPLFPYTTLFRSKLYVADTNNHAIRVVDLKTRETTTLRIKGLQPPDTSSSETSKMDVAPNLEEIKLRSEEHTSELQSRGHLVCRLLLEKKKRTTN